MYRVGVAFCVLLSSTSLVWSQAAQPVVPIVDSLVVSATNPLPITGSITVPSPLNTNATVYLGGNPVAAANPFPSAPVVAGAVISSTNPVPSNTYVAGSLVSFANPFPSGISVSGSAASTSNPVPTAVSVSGAAVTFANPFPSAISTGGSAVSNANPFAVNSIVAGSPVSTANPLPSQPTLSGAAVSNSNPLPVSGVIGGAAISPSNPLAVANAVGGASVSATNPLPVANNLTSRMYAAAATAFSRTTAGDLFCLTGSASKTIKVRRFNASATAMGATTIDVSIVLRSTLDTGGTPTGLTEVPFSSTNAAATAVATAYGTAPTAGTLIGAVAANKYTALPTNTSQGVLDNFFLFNTTGDQALTLNGATQAACLTVGAVSSGNWNFDVMWSEE